MSRLPYPILSTDDRPVTGLPSTTHNNYRAKRALGRTHPLACEMVAGERASEKEENYST